MDEASNLFGTTSGNGSGALAGVAFELAPNVAETVLYTFCSEPGCTDGALTGAPLILDASGHLFGTTQAGGANGGGAVFELTP